MFSRSLFVVFVIGVLRNGDNEVHAMPSDGGTSIVGGVNVVVQGDEHGFFYTDESGFKLGQPDANGTFKYLLPDNTSECYNNQTELNMFMLLPQSLQSELQDIYGVLKELLARIDVRLGQFLDDLEDAIYEIWKDTEGLPLLGDVINLANNDTAQYLTLGSSDTLWITGDVITCFGPSAFRLNGTNKRCNNGVAVQYSSCIQPDAFEGITVEDTLGTSTRHRRAVNTTSPTVSSPTPSPTTLAQSLECSSNETLKLKSSSFCPRTTADWGTPPPNDLGPNDLTNYADYRIRKLLVILVKFKDHSEPHPPGDYEKLFNARGGDGKSTAGSIRDYFLENSYNRVDTVTYVVPEWFEVDWTEAEAAGGTYGMRNNGGRMCSSYAQALAQAFETYNFFGDGVDLDSFVGDTPDQARTVLFLHSGRPAEQSYVGEGDKTNRVWSHKTSLSGCRINSQFRTWAGQKSASGDISADYDEDNNNLKISDKTGNSFSFSEYTVTNGAFGAESALSRLGVIVHELGHSSLHSQTILDYYEVGSGSPVFPSRCGGDGKQTFTDVLGANGKGAGIGSWGLMGDSWGPCGDQVFPPHLSAWSKIQLGWIHPIVVSDADYNPNLELHMSEMCPDALVVRGETGTTSERGFADDREFLVVENRQKVGIDSALPSGGLAVYHIDNSKTTQNQAFSNGDTATNVNAHYYIRMEQADGNDDLECGGKADGNDLYNEAGNLIGSNDRIDGQLHSTAGYYNKKFSNTRISIKLRKVDTNITAGAPIETSVTISGDEATTPNPELQYSKSCGDGEYSERGGNCRKCPVGKYRDPTAGQFCNSACQICPDGTYSNSEGATSCTACPVGTYDDIGYYPSNESSCKPCPTDWTGVLIPGLAYAQEYCNNGQKFNSYHGGKYNKYEKRDATCTTTSVVLFGLTEMELIYIGAGIIGFMLLVVVFTKCHSHKLHKKNDFGVKTKAPRKIRPNRGFLKPNAEKQKAMQQEQMFELQQLHQQQHRQQNLAQHPPVLQHRQPNHAHQQQAQNVAHQRVHPSDSERSFNRHEQQAEEQNQRRQRHMQQQQPQHQQPHSHKQHHHHQQQQQQPSHTTLNMSPPKTRFQQSSAV